MISLGEAWQSGSCEAVILWQLLPGPAAVWCQVWVWGAVRNAGAEIESAVESVELPRRLHVAYSLLKTVGGVFF